MAEGSHARQLGRSVDGRFEGDLEALLPGAPDLHLLGRGDALLRGVVRLSAAAQRRLLAVLERQGGLLEDVLLHGGARSRENQALRGLGRRGQVHHGLPEVVV